MNLWNYLVGGKANDELLRLRDEMSEWELKKIASDLDEYCGAGIYSSSRGCC